MQQFRHWMHFHTTTHSPVKGPPPFFPAKAVFSIRKFLPALCENLSTRSLCVVGLAALETVLIT